MSEDVELSIQGEIALLQLRRPSLGNALRGTTFDALRKTALRLADAPPRFIVVHGEGADFCTGLDPDRADALYADFRPAVAARDAYRTQELVGRMRSAFEALGRLPCPVVAAIEGRCHGAGLALALSVDLRIASSTATFRFAEAHDGLLTGLGGLSRLALLVGAGRATDIALTGTEKGAAEAMSLGLLHRVCAPGAALSTALDVVHEMRRSTPLARQQTLLAIRAVHQALVQAAIDHETQAAARTWIAAEWQAPAKDPNRA